MRKRRSTWRRGTHKDKVRIDGRYTLKGGKGNIHKRRKRGREGRNWKEVYTEER